DPVDYPADGGDDGDDEEGSSEDDEDDDMDIKADDEEEEDHLAPADFIVVALPATDQAPSAEETKPFETDESAATPPPHPAYRSGRSSSSAHNVAFIGYECTTSTSEVSTAYGSSTSPSQHTHKESSSSYVDEVMHSFFANQPNPTEVSYEDLTQVDKHELEEMDLKWQMAMLSIRVNKFYKKTGKRLKFNEKEPASFDKSKVECFKCHKMGHFARECRSKGTQD
ncbi:ribonuclease H-like domain-containing protein, partial [Tanacetum coccineum]